MTSLKRGLVGMNGFALVLRRRKSKDEWKLPVFLKLLLRSFCAFCKRYRRLGAGIDFAPFIYIYFSIYKSAKASPSDAEKQTFQG